MTDPKLITAEEVEMLRAAEAALYETTVAVAQALGQPQFGNDELAPAVERLRAENVLLKNALIQAQQTVEFLHSCLTKPSTGPLDGGYRYVDPERTLRRLAKWRKLAPPPPAGCHHAAFKPECPGCVARRARYAEVDAAAAVLARKDPS